MTLPVLALVGVVTHEVLARRDVRHSLVVAGAAALALAAPLVVLPIGIGVAGVAGVAAVRRVERSAEAASADLPLLADLTVLGLSAGLTFPAAIERARRGVNETLGAEVGMTLRRARLEGATGVFAATEGDTARLFRVVARAAGTGAPVLGAVASYAADLRSIEAADRRAAAERLPVRLLFPLALLILPGFLLMTVAPSVLGALQRLDL